MAASYLGSLAIRPLLPKPPRSQQQQQQQPPPQQQQQKTSQQQQQQENIPLLTATSTAAAATQKRKPVAAETTDWVASSLTRRFGLGAGLAWVGFLAVGVFSEQVKTRFEASQQEANTKDVEKVEEVVLPNGMRYYELRVGGGATPQPGDLVVIDLQGRVEGDNNISTFVDTFAERKRPLALVLGSRPYTKGMCEGIEYVLRTMKAGGRRRVIVPPKLGFGDDGAALGDGVVVPPAATLEYVVQVDRVSIGPS